MKKKSKKLAKLERQRYSVFYPDLQECCMCGVRYPISKHEIFPGRNRQNSMQYGFVLPLCLRCHQELQNDKSFNDLWQKKAQHYFEEHYGTREDFISIFRRSYK